MSILFGLRWNDSPLMVLSKVKMTRGSIAWEYPRSGAGKAMAHEIYP